MIRAIIDLLSSESLMPHAMCFLWRPDLVWLHSLSDGFIALAYYSIPFALVVFAYKRRDLVFRSMFLLFGLFILACGTTHAMSIWTLWNPDYGVEGLVKLVTAAASVGTAIALWRVMPRALALPSPAQLTAANQALEVEIAERRRAEATVRSLNAELEERVRARTAELEESNRRLEASLHDKEVLLQEVHHRVKNNLQVISALLTMQARTTRPELMTYFEESLQRIRAMARVHAQLYTSNDTAAFDLRQYVEGLAADLSEAYGAAQITCTVEGMPVRIDFDTATPLVLIVNEALSNAFKHAFPDHRSGEIAVSVRRDGDATVLTIRDNGVGLPEDFEARRQRSMGLRLIDMLARQINATVAYTSGNGTGFSLALPATAADSG